MAMILVGCSESAGAQSTAQVDLYGYVAPRCWAAAGPSRARAVCNQAQPMLRTSIRMISADGVLAEGIPSAQLSSRTALEIIVSPQP